MRLAVLKERAAAETRVAATPDTVKKLVSMGLEVAIEAGAGAPSAIRDEDYTAMGAHIVPDAGAALTGADIVFAVGMPPAEIRSHIPRGALLACTSGTTGDAATVAALAEAGIDVAAMELLPRITRAQGMDILSSQANLAGYRAVIEGAAAFERGFPMMMTAAGTVPPARGVRDRRRGGRGCRLSPPPGAWVPSSPRPTCARRPRKRSSRSAPPMSA